MSKAKRVKITSKFMSNDTLPTSDLEMPRLSVEMWDKILIEAAILKVSPTKNNIQQVYRELAAVSRLWKAIVDGTFFQIHFIQSIVRMYPSKKFKKPRLWKLTGIENHADRLVTILNEEIYVCQRGSNTINIFTPADYTIQAETLVLRPVRTLHLTNLVGVLHLDSYNSALYVNGVSKTGILCTDQVVDTTSGETTDSVPPALPLHPPWTQQLSGMRVNYVDPASGQSYELLHQNGRPLNPTELISSVYLASVSSTEAQVDTVVEDIDGFRLNVDHTGTLFLYGSDGDLIRKLGRMRSVGAGNFRFRLDEDRGLLYVWNPDSNHLSVHSIVYHCCL